MAKSKKTKEQKWTGILGSLMEDLQSGNQIRIAQGFDTLSRHTVRVPAEALATLLASEHTSTREAALEVAAKQFDNPEIRLPALTAAARCEISSPALDAAVGTLDDNALLELLHQLLGSLAQKEAAFQIRFSGHWIAGRPPSLVEQHIAAIKRASIFGEAPCDMEAAFWASYLAAARASVGRLEHCFDPDLLLLIALMLLLRFPEHAERYGAELQGLASKLLPTEMEVMADYVMSLVIMCAHELQLFPAMARELSLAILAAAQEEGFFAEGQRPQTWPGSLKLAVAAADRLAPLRTAYKKVKALLPTDVDRAAAPLFRD